MAGKIFINYRRDDDPAFAARVRDALATPFGKSNLFMDVDNLLAGQRFDKELGKALADCDVLIAIIGTRWMDLLKSKSAAGDRDYVREEISEALKRDIVVIPVRVGREGQMLPLPRHDDLPPGIRDLVQYQKFDVAHEHFGRDVEGLVTAIRAVRKTKAPQRKSLPWLQIVAGALGLIVVGYIGAHFAGASVPWPFEPTIRTDYAAIETARQEAERERIARQKAEADAKNLRDEAEARRKVDQLERQRQANIKLEEDRKRAEAEASARNDQAEELHTVFIAPDLARQLQVELRRVGCFTSDVDGEWDANSRQALELFNKYAGTSLYLEYATQGSVDAVRGKTTRICP